MTESVGDATLTAARSLLRRSHPFFFYNPSSLLSVEIWVMDKVGAKWNRPPKDSSGTSRGTAHQ